MVYNNARHVSYILLIVDTSSSMADKIDELNAGVEALKTALMEDDTTQHLKYHHIFQNPT